MKKILYLFLALCLLFLTACNTISSTSSDGSSTSSSSDDKQMPSTSDFEDSIIQNKFVDFIHLPSRVIFSTSISSGTQFNVYYSKTDGKAYIYCFDPLCDHSDGKCLAQPITVNTSGIYFGDTKFINNRFWCAALFTGKIISFNFDGTDMKIEYDAKHSMDKLPTGGVFSPGIMAYDSCLYIPQDSTSSTDGKPHVLQFNTETGEMNDLTEKTGNYLIINFFYNGNIYGQTEMGEPCKCDLDLDNMEIIEKIPVANHYSGSRAFETMYDEKGNMIGIEVCDMKTGDTVEITNSALGIPENATPEISFVDDNYMYFYHSKKELVGYYPHPKTGKQVARYRWNDGKLYRANHDGANVICIHNETNFEFDGESIVFDNKIISKGKYVGMRNGIADSWGSGYYAGTFDENGMINEWKPIEVVG